jgi:hypothetical protein
MSDPYIVSRYSFASEAAAAALPPLLPSRTWAALLPIWWEDYGSVGVGWGLMHDILWLGDTLHTFGSLVNHFC